MSESLLCSDIESWLREHAYGHAQAKPRRLLLEYLHSQGHSIDDRRMRKEYESLDKVGSCGQGLFLIVTAEDRRVAQGALVAPAASMFDRKRRIEKSAPQGQGELFP
jgi:hypothetical protein